MEAYDNDETATGYVRDHHVKDSADMDNAKKEFEKVLDDEKKKIEDQLGNEIVIGEDQDVIPMECIRNLDTDCVFGDADHFVSDGAADLDILIQLEEEYERAKRELEDAENIELSIFKAAHLETLENEELARDNANIGKFRMQYILKIGSVMPHFEGIQNDAVALCEEAIKEAGAHLITMFTMFYSRRRFKRVAPWSLKRRRSKRFA